MRRIRLIVELVFVITSIVVLPLIDKIGQTPNWVGSWLYTVLVIIGVLVLFGIYWIWLESGEKTDIEELEEGIDLKFDNQAKGFKRLINEIKKDRRVA